MLLVIAGFPVIVADGGFRIDVIPKFKNTTKMKGQFLTAGILFIWRNLTQTEWTLTEQPKTPQQKKAESPQLLCQLNSRLSVQACVCVCVCKCVCERVCVLSRLGKFNIHERMI